ncbi:MAG: DUF4118 domain-containing protein [Anaerolineae bacterium]|nr:DUF4118 domain-containing protein [Anaerolineae bacterium]
MKKLPPPLNLLLGVVLSSAIVLICSLVLLQLRGTLNTAIIALLFLIPVVVSATAWGLPAGVTASILSFLIFNYFFLSPFLTFRVEHPQDILAMIVLLGVAILISSLMANAQRRLKQVQAREHEALMLYEMSTELAGRNDEPAIARILANHLARLFNTQRVEVAVMSSGKPFTAAAPETEGTPAGAVLTELPLASPRGNLGTIRIWSVPTEHDPQAEQLLKTIASQASLALDTASLDASERRAHLLEESERIRSAILSSVSHELRTPLASIQAAVTSLYNPALELEPAARAELETLLQEETDHMIQLVGNLLNMSRIEAGALNLQRQWNSLSEILDGCAKRLHRMAEKQGVRLVMDIPEELPLVAVDAVLMEQVFFNLVGNSIKFAPAGSEVRISGEADDQVMQVTISNQGPPIDEDHLPHVFEKFYPSPGKETVRGAGMGLSICKGILEAHGGSISATNLNGGGVAFTFTLPLVWENTRPTLPAGEGAP